MRKLVAVTMVALLALTLALVVVGCAKKAEDTTAAPAETSMPPAETAMPESAMADTSMGH
jgi:hypothetical protein